MSILEIIENIKKTSSTLGKKAILENHKNDEVLKKVLKYTLDPTIVSGYKKLPDPFYSGTKYDLEEAINQLEDIYSRKYTGHDGRDHISYVLGAVSADDAEVLRKMLTKNLDCGVQEKNCNDVFGKGFIKDEPYMRCSLIDKKTARNINFKKYGYAVSEVKMDGQYLNHTVRNNSFTSTSRNGKVYDFLGCRDDIMIHLANIIQTKDNRFGSGVVFMGEGLVLDENGENILPRTTGNGIIQKAGKDGITLNEAMRTVFALWDVVPYDAFCEGIWDVCRKERRELLESAIAELQDSTVRMVKYKKVKNLNEAFDYNTELMNAGEEGSVLKCEDGIWKSHTSPKQLKMKLKMQVDLRIIGFNKGEGKRKDVLGSLILESDCGMLEVSCGTGIKEKDDEWTFKTIWENREELLNKIVTVECNEIVIDKNTMKPSLFLPVFIEIRFDKNLADTYDRIMEIRSSAVEVFSKSILDSIK